MGLGGVLFSDVFFNCRESVAVLIPHFIIVTLYACALRRPLFSPHRPALTRGLLQPTYTILGV